MKLPFTPMKSLLNPMKSLLVPIESPNFTHGSAQVFRFPPEAKKHHMITQLGHRDEAEGLSWRPAKLVNFYGNLMEMSWWYFRMI